MKTLFAFLFCFSLFVHADATKRIGDKCTFDSDCVSNNCHFSTCATKDGATKQIGETCNFDSDCVSNNCHFSTCAVR